jgi:hypothetical protein
VNTIVLMLYDLLRQNWALLLVLGLLAGAWLFLRTPADPVSWTVSARKSAAVGPSWWSSSPTPEAPA